MSLIRDIVSLSKPFVTLGVAFTSLTGYLLNAVEINGQQLFSLVVGVILMSAGAATFNHVFERRFDSQMKRTKSRPIASGRLSVKTGTLIGATMLTLGLVILWISINPICALLGAVNAFWYLAVYTPLKRISVWAVFVGSLTGVIPFFMGVVATNTNILVPVNLFIGIYLMMWQIPHFILLAYKYADDYKKAGLASILNYVSNKQLIKIYYLWMVSCCIITFSFPLFGYLHYDITGWIIFGLSIIVLITIAIDFLNKSQQLNFYLFFMITNLMQVILLATLIGDRILTHF